MPINVKPPVAKGARLAVVTAAFDPHFPDCDECLLATAIAAEAGRRGWNVSILALSSVTELDTRLNVTLEVLRRFDIGLRVVISDAHPQARAGALAMAIEAIAPRIVIATEPSIVAHYAEAARRGALGAPAGLAVLLNRLAADALDQRGQFLDDSVPLIADQLAVRALRAADHRFAISPAAQAQLERLGIGESHCLDPAPLVARLLQAVAPGASQASLGDRRLVVFGNLDTRSGIEVILDALLAAHPALPELRLIGHAEKTPTTHGLTEIARFAARYAGEWSVSFGIDVLRCVTEVRAGDTLLSFDDGGFIVAPLVAAAAGAACFRRRPGISQRQFTRELVARIRESRFEIEPPVDVSAPSGLESLLADAANRQSVAPRDTPAPGPRVEIVALCAYGAPDDFFLDFQPAQGMRLFALGDGLSAEPLQNADSAYTRLADGAALHRQIAKSDADFVVLVPDSLRLASGGRRIADALAGSRAAAIIWPMHGQDAQPRHPRLLVPDLLVDDEPVPAAFAVSPAYFRRAVPKLTSRSPAGLSREIVLRLALDGIELMDQPEPKFSRMFQPAPSIGYPLAAQRELTMLAGIVAEKCGAALEDSIHLYQGQILTARQQRAAGPWQLEADPPADLARFRGIRALSALGRARPDGPLSLERLLGGLGHVQPFALTKLPASPAVPAAASGEASAEAFGSTEIFVAWVAELARNHSFHVAMSKLELSLADLPPERREALRVLARYVIEASPSLRAQ